MAVVIASKCGPSVMHQIDWSYDSYIIIIHDFTSHQSSLTPPTRSVPISDDAAFEFHISLPMYAEEDLLFLLLLFLFLFLLSSLVISTPRPTTTTTTTSSSGSGRSSTTTTTTSGGSGRSSTTYCEICTDNKDSLDMLHLPPCFHSFCSDCVSSHVTADPGQSSACFCDICTDNKDPRDMLHLPPCFHSFCSDCISSHVAARLQSNTTVVPCPALDCGSLLEFSDIAAVLRPEVAARWNDMLCEALIPASERFYCPFKDCSAMMVMEEKDRGAIRESECPECHRLFCARCLVGWHAGIKCKDFERLNKDERGREDLMVKEMAKRRKWPRCPRCKFYIEKAEGCLHMTCRCGFEFCYACGATWSQRHGGCRP